METKIKWNEGDGYITATYEGSGSGSASISSDVNEGIDREQSIKVETTDKSVSATLVVSQEGLREVFLPSDGDFDLADGGTFNVIKSEMGGVSYEPIEYVEFQKDKMYDTGINVTDTMTLSIRFQKGGNVTTAQYMYGVITSPHTASVTAYLSSSGAWRFGSKSRNLTINDGNVREVEISNGVISVNGTIYTFSKSGSFVTPHTLPIGGSHSSSGYRTPQFTGYIYGFRIKDGEDVLLDWTPMRRNDGVEGFWDNVTNKFIEKEV